jgi:hypothetical protein
VEVVAATPIDLQIVRFNKHPVVANTMEFKAVRNPPEVPALDGAASSHSSPLMSPGRRCECQNEKRRNHDTFSQWVTKRGGQKTTHETQKHCTYFFIFFI